MQIVWVVVMIRPKILCFPVRWGIIRLIMPCCWLAIPPLIGLLKTHGALNGALMALPILVEIGLIIKTVLSIRGLQLFKSTVLLPTAINAPVPNLTRAQYAKMVTTLYLMARLISVNNVLMWIAKHVIRSSRTLRYKADVRFVWQATLYKLLLKPVNRRKKCKLLIALFILLTITHV